MAKIAINKLRLDGGTQQRASLDAALVADYAEAVLDGAKFPPVRAIYDGKHYWLWSGFHRVAGHKEAGLKDIEFEVERGTQRDAIDRSHGANSEHGKRRTPDDKRFSVTNALMDSYYDTRSDRDIAKLCNVSHTFVASLRSDDVKVKRAENVSSKKPQKSSGEPSSDEAPTDLVATLPRNKGGNVATSEHDDETPGAVKVTRPGVKPVGNPEALRQELDHAKAELAEMTQMCSELNAELAAANLLVLADDQIVAARDEAKKLREMNRVLEERNNGLQNEKNEAIKLAKYWQRKAGR